MAEDKQSEKAKAAPHSEEGSSSLRGLTDSEQDHPPWRIGAKLRNYFLTGLIIVGPVGITVYILWWFVNLIDAWVKPLIPHQYLPENYLPFSVPGVGLIFAIFGLMVVGALAANLFGRTIVSWGEMMLDRMPIVRNLYRALKQIFESILSVSAPEQAFQKVGLMEFPSKGIWSIVFVTGEAARQISSLQPQEDLVSVFMPTGMLPPTGFVCFVPRASVTIIGMSVEDAAKIIISAGMVNPETQARLRELKESAAAADASKSPRA